MNRYPGQYHLYRFLNAALLMLLAVPAMAHSDHEHGSFYLGFIHPIYGTDHLLAMITVGFLSARMDTPRKWTLPLAFVAMMASGGLLGMVWASDGLALFEWGITLSVILFGLITAAAPRVPVTAGHAVVALFAICHGHAHVAEMGSASAWGYFPGMLLATGVLHIVGLIVGLLLHKYVGDWAVRVAGGVVAGYFAVTLVLDMM